MDGTAVLSGPRAPTQDDGVEGDHWIDISSAEFSFFKKDGDGWTKLANLRQPARDPRVGPVSGGGGSGSGSAKGYTTSNLPMTGLGRSTRGGDDGKAGGINKPGGNIIPKATDLKFQSNFNRWAVESLDALDEALPVAKVDELPDEGKYEGDMVLQDGTLHIWVDKAWVAVGGSGEPTPGKEQLPWLQIEWWKVEFKDRTAWGEAWMYQAFYSYNSSASWTWQYEIDANGDGNWIDIAAHPQKEALGYFPDGENQASLLLQKKNQTVDFPNALMRFRLTGSLNDYDSELSTEAVPAWADTFEQYDPPKYASGLEGILDAYATKEYANQAALRSTAVAQTQADWTNQVYSSGTWILQTGGATNPQLQRYILTNEAFEDTSEFAEAKYISVHALGGGDFIHYQFEKPGDTIQVYGNPLSGDLQASFGIYRIDEITEHNFPDNPDDDGADFSDAFVAYTVTPLATHGVVEPNEMCQIKTMPQWVRSVVALKRTLARTHRLTPRLAISGIAPSSMI